MEREQKKKEKEEAVKKKAEERAKKAEEAAKKRENRAKKRTVPTSDTGTQAKKRKTTSESTAAGTSTTTAQQALLILLAQGILHAYQQQHILVQVRMILMQPLILMYVVFAITHLRMTSGRAMDWNGFSVSVGGGYMRSAYVK